MKSSLIAIVLMVAVYTFAVSLFVSEYEHTDELLVRYFKHPVIDWPLTIAFCYILLMLTMLSCTVWIMAAGIDRSKKNLKND